MWVWADLHKHTRVQETITITLVSRELYNSKDFDVFLQTDESKWFSLTDAAERAQHFIYLLDWYYIHYT